MRVGRRGNDGVSEGDSASLGRTEVRVDGRVQERRELGARVRVSGRCRCGNAGAR